MKTELKQLICETGKRLYNNGFCAANDGNISVRLTSGEILCTPANVSKGFMTPEMICTVDADGKILSNNDYKPSSEIKMHLRVYKERADINAVVHAHPPYATAHAVIGKPLNEPIMAEAIVALGEVPITDYGTPSTEEIPEAVAKLVANYDNMLLANHGALAYAFDLTQAFFQMESIEFYAKLLYLSKTLGTPRLLTSEQIKKIKEVTACRVSIHTS
ncbi:MAG: class II aldolase/adducin family protein [Clostridiales bacterium]|jgi:L-fuculose-phosphate aldolase|nr:class II aldolase/adducin family protein [Clostridiales bacterium]